MATVESLTLKLTYAKKQKAYAWAKYYDQVTNALHEDHGHYHQYHRVVSEDAIPQHIKNEMMEMAKTLRKKWECPICMEMIEDGNLEISNCGHYYCKPCLVAHQTHQKSQGKEKWECAVCRRKHSYKADDE